MSARPGLATLPDAELELLVSRALDGDLLPEEERELSSYLAEHPEARARYADMEALVARLRGLPAPEPPFALATRVSSQVAERSRGLGALGQRFGLYLPPGLVAAGIGVVALGGVLAALFGSPRRAEKVASLQKSDGGPVHVFFQEAPTAAPRAAAPQAAASGRPNEAERVAADETAKLERRVDTLSAPASGVRAEQAEGKAKESDAAAPREEVLVASAQSRARFAPEPAAPPAALRDAPSRDAASAAAPAGAAAAPAAAQAKREKAAAPPELSIALVSGAGWRLLSPPPPPPGASASDGTYRLALDDSGRVQRVERGANAPPAELERFLGSLLFERLPGASAAREVEVRVVLR